ncbi:DDE 1, HTH Tnp Tc5, and/or CENP-B N domain containing protein [Asbolus verrucosus]|uniref:DDE 1, HTH Tnp Tc5, and/or CENP-B N domain containing protein n=1 Tax=Asbolus verrucosus TaxID=1661398 RepID=A0A482VFC5_ASBVE|nr:DDE 1, HTH Tnp Tc5, and/or CENP-B N domain containing protein [Asbolus verrucosus]
MSKRKRVVLNFQQKLEILQQLDEGKSGAVLAKQYGIGTSTISDIKRNGDVILQFVSNLDCQKQISEKKTRKTAQNTDLDSKVYKWYAEEKERGRLPVDSVICAKALEINKQLSNGNENFKASPGWLRHFKNRHGIKDAIKEQPEPQTSSGITKQLKNVLKRSGYTLENVYNADECVLEWKTLPNIDDSKRVTLIVCTNANASHKLPLWIIGPDKRNGISPDHSVVYRHQKSVRMNTHLFQDWVDNHFVPEVKRRQLNTGNVGKILLIIDDAPWHPSCDVLVKDQVDVFLLTDNSTPIQPMDLGVKCRLKIIYRKKLLQLLLTRLCPIKQFLEEFTSKESVSLIAEAWDSIPRTAIVQSWGRLLSDVKTEAALGRDEEVAEIVAIAEKVAGLDPCDVNDITRWLDRDKEDCDNYIHADDSRLSSEESQDDGQQEPSHMEAYQCLHTVVQWFRRQGECNSDQLTSLERLRDLAATKICGEIKEERD